MLRAPLVRWREIWLPTIWGWLALLLIEVGVLVLGAQNLHSFLTL